MKSLFSMICFMIWLTACSSQPEKLTVPPTANSELTITTVTGKEQIQGQIIGTMLPGCRFSSLQIGMTRMEVERLIGTPTELSAQTTGGSWAPYSFGSNSLRIESYYKNEGRLVFDAESHLVLIDVSDKTRK